VRKAALYPAWVTTIDLVCKGSSWISAVGTWGRGCSLIQIEFEVLLKAVGGSFEVASYLVAETTSRPSLAVLAIDRGLRVERRFAVDDGAPAELGSASHSCIRNPRTDKGASNPMIGPAASQGTLRCPI
jgi:hypothetical protein